MSAAQVATAYVALMPSAEGMHRHLAREIAGQSKGVGDKAGQIVGKDMSQGAAKQAKKDMPKGMRGAMEHAARDSGKEADTAGGRAGKKFAGGFGASAKGALKGAAGGFIAAFGIQAAKDAFTNLSAAAEEANNINAKSATLIKTTGGAANVTAQQVENLSQQLAAKTFADDEAIQSGSNLILTFKNIKNVAGEGNDIFNQTTEAALNLSAAGFGSIESASIMLGKALNDPVKGISALSEAGVTFTDSQKAMVEQLVASGDVLGAQKIILKEVEGQVGGMAETAQTAGGELSKAFGDFQEMLGQKLLPVSTAFYETISSQVLPALSRFIDEFSQGTGAAGQLRDVLSVTGQVISTVAQFLWAHRNAVAAVTLALGAAYTAYKAVQLGIAAYHAALAVGAALSRAYTIATKAMTVAQWLLNAALSANPIGIVIAALAALGAGMVLAYKKSTTFRNIVNGAWRSVRATTQAVFGWITGTALPKFRSAMSATGRFFRTVVDGIRRTASKIKGAFEAPIKFVMNNVLKNKLARGWNNVADKLKLPHWNFKGYKRGGWTGPGAESDIAGITHADEFVIRKRARQKFEREHPGMLDFLNKHGYLPGFLRGGRVPPARHPVGGQAGLIAFGRWLRSMGYRVAEGPGPFGPVHRVHSRNSLHYRGGAIDVNSRPGQSALEMRELDEIVPFARAYGLRTIWRTKGHFNHAHFDVGRGADIGGGGAIAWVAEQAADKLKKLISVPFNAGRKLANSVFPKFGHSAWANVGKAYGLQPIDKTQDWLNKKIDKFFGVNASTSGNADASTQPKGGKERELPARHAMMDAGGWLMPGNTLVSNHTGKPERVRTWEQEKALLNGAPTINVYGVRYDTVGEVSHELAFAMRRASARARYSYV